MEPFTIETRISEKDYQQLMLRLLLRERKGLRIMLIMLAVLLPLSLVIAPSSNAKDIVGTIVPLLMLVPIILLLRWAIVRQLRKTYRSNKALQHAVYYTFDEQAIQSKGTAFEGSISWSNIARTTKAGNWMLLYTSNASAIMIAINTMTPEQLSFIASKTGSKQ